jgi:hypothetical protein
MRVFFLLLLTCAPMSAFASDYLVTQYTWCNGPYTGTDGAACPSYSAWNQVELKMIKSVSIDVSPSHQFLKLTDSSAHTWEQELAKCQSPASDPAGCRSTLSTKPNGELSIMVSQWRSGEMSQRLSLILSPQNELSIFGPDNSYFVITLKPN